MLPLSPEAPSEALTGPVYELRTPSRHRRRFHVGHRAHLFVSEPFSCGVPDGEFLLEQHGFRYRLKKDGRLTRKLVYAKLLAHRNAERQRERWYHPVRVLEITPISGRPVQQSDNL